MISDSDLATLRIRNIIFHDIPRNSSGSTGTPTLADAETEIDSSRSSMLKKRLVRTLGSRSAYEIQFSESSSSPVPAEVKDFTAKSHNIGKFIEMSQRLAQYLFDQQNGQMSAGLLCVMDIITGGRRGLAVLKLEREQGADLQLKTTAKGRRFEMSVLDNLVFTDGTRLFKSALFINAGNNEFLATACDSQKTVMSSTDVARFWLRFLGCRVTEEPRVATQKWFDSTVEFVNEFIAEAVTKNDVYEHLLSELKSNKKRISPKKFIEDYFPDAYRREYQDFLAERNISMQGFEKDISDIKTKISRKLFQTKGGVTVTVPADRDQLVEIEPEQITVRDSLRTVATK